MLAKVIARGATREEARRRLVAALGETVILGVTTNVSYLRRVLSTENVVRGDVDTSYLERAEVPPPSPPGEDVFRAAAYLFATPEKTAPGEAPRFPDPFETPFRSLSA